MSDQNDAFDHYARAYHLATTATIPRVTIEALIGRAEAGRRLGHQQSGRLEQATDDAAAAVRHATWSGYRVLEGNARAALARIHLDRGQVHEAIEQARLALAAHRGTGHRPGEATTLRLLGEALLRDAQPDGRDQPEIAAHCG